MNSSSPCSSVAIAAYAESFVAGRRVVTFGDASSPLAQHLLDRGARFVHVFDPDEKRLRTLKGKTTARTLSHAPLNDTELGRQERTFDFAVVENLNAFAKPTLLLQQVASALVLRGAALIGVPNPEARMRLVLGAAPASAAQPLGYYELYDQAAELFADIRMLGQLPFVGYAVADFSAEREADISVDTAFVPGGAEEPEWFWALCSQEPMLGDTFSIIQVPLLQAFSPDQPGAASPPAPAAKVSVEPNPVAETVQARVVELETQLKQKETWIAELEARAATADSRADDAEAKLARWHQTKTAEQASAQPPKQWEVERAQLKVQLEKAEQAARTAQQPAEDPLRDERRAKSRDDVANLEALLQERAAVVQDLEQRSVEAERVVGDLVRELDALRKQQAAPPAPTEPSKEVIALQAKLNNLAQANAERAALLANAETSIAELELKLQQATVQPLVQSPAQLGLAPGSLERQPDLTPSTDLPS